MSKLINEMSFSECLVFIRKGDYLRRHVLADRIDTLLDEQNQRHDARVDALENEIAKHRWIPVEERLPTEEDGDEHGYVQWWSENEVAIPVAHYWDFTGVPKYMFTHWRRIDKAEGV